MNNIFYLFWLLTTWPIPCFLAGETRNGGEGEFCRDPGRQHYAVTSANICISKGLDLDQCLSVFADFEVALVKDQLSGESPIVCQHDEDEQIASWWPESERRMMSNSEQHYLADLQEAIQKNHTNTFDTATSILTPDFVVYVVKLLAEKSGNARMALDFLQDIWVQNTNKCLISNFTVLEWSFLSCKVDSTLCERSIYVLEILLSSKSVPSMLAFYASWYLSGLWEIFEPGSDRAFQHFSAAIHIAAMIDGFEYMPWQELHFDIAPEEFPKWLDALPDMLPSKLRWSTMHCSSKAVKEFFGDNLLTHLTAAGLSQPIQVMVNVEEISAPGIWIKGREQNFTNNDTRYGIIVPGATYLNYNDLPNFRIANKSWSLPPVFSFKGVDGNMSSNSQQDNNETVLISKCAMSLPLSKLDGACKLFTTSGGILCRNPLLITGCGYSGTAFTAKLLNKLNLVNKDTLQRFVTVHENFYLPHDFLVCWFCRSDFWKLHGMGSTVDNGVILLDGIWRFPYMNNPNPCLYDVVLHQVRHPLKFFSSALAEFMKLELYNGNLFSHTLRWIEANTWPPIRFPSQVEMKARGRQGFLNFLMLHWISWNQMVESIADHTFQVEKADWIDLLCSKAGLVLRSQLIVCDEDTASATAKLENLKQIVLKEASSLNSHGGKMHVRVTWGELELVNPALAAQIWKMAERYGYGREPHS